MSFRQHLGISVLLVVIILVFGFVNRPGANNKEMIAWSENDLTWSDFELVRHMENDYVATIYSTFSCPNLITSEKSRVFAYMNPNFSKKLRGEYDSENVLIHEQYHFHITEYCTRLLRKEIVQRGLGGLSFKVIKDLKTKYSKKLDSLQNVYDSITDHNGDWEKQKYWEMKIDDWLRETAYYENDNIYSYYDFTKNRTSFYRKIYFTMTQKVLTSFPVGKKDITHGETYEISFPYHNEKVVKFYKDGKPFNGGYFESAITKIRKNGKGEIEILYLNPDESYNQKVSCSIKKIYVDENENMIVHYFNHTGKRIRVNSVFETRWKYDEDEKSYFSTNYDKSGKNVSNTDGIYHEKRVLDEKERTIVFENLDRKRNLKNDSDFIAKREINFNENHLKINEKLFDENGQFAFHLEDFHLRYDYDERGNIEKIFSLNEDGRYTYDKSGASIYEYVYDLKDRVTSVKRFNKDYDPVVANDDYFQVVRDYDSLNRVVFKAYYYPNKVLKYSDEMWGASKYSYQGDSVVYEYNYDAYGDLFDNENDVATVKKRLDSKGQVISERYFNSNGAFSKAEDGVSEYRHKYDSQGRTIETSAYDSLGKRTEIETDVAIIRWEYDENGHKSKTTYLNRKEKLARAKDGATYNRYKYDKNGNLMERTNHDKNMEPVVEDHIFKTQFVVNSSGLDSIVYKYDVDNKLTSGAAITKYYYNKYNNKVRTEYFDKFNKRVSNDQGVSTIGVIYNKRQQIVAYQYFDHKGRRINDVNGVSREEYVLNELGHTLSYRYLDKNLNPVIGPNGYHKLSYEWGSVGEISKQETFGADLSYLEDKQGIAVYKYDLRPSGLYSKISRFDKNGTLAENKYGVAVTKYTSYLDGLYYLEEELNAAGNVINDSISK